MRTLALSIFLIACSVITGVSPSSAEQAKTALRMETAAQVGAVTGYAIPRYVSLKSNQINLRNGPGRRYPIAWQMNRADLPVVVVDEYEHWRQIRTHDGIVGWVHKSLISGKRTFRVMDERLSMRRRPTRDGSVVALLAEGMVGTLDRCREVWCRATVVDATGSRYRGWVQRKNLFGINPGETL